MTKVCICQICNCGRHRCPHNAPKTIHKGDRPCLLSEYKNKYNPYEVAMRKSCKPDYQPLVNEQPIEDKTTNRQDYVKHPMEKPFLRNPEGYIPPDGALESMTSYKKDFNAKPIKVTKPIIKDRERRIPAKFEGLPTYKNDYKKWEIPHTQRIIHDDMYQPPDTQFQGLTNYKLDYPAHKGGVVRESMRPLERQNSPGAFADSTGYRTEYVKHPLPEKKVKEVAQWCPNKVPLEDVSNYKKDYIAKHGGKPASFKPTNGGYKSDAPFVDATTQRVDFQPWKTERPFIRDPDSYKTPVGAQDWNTTSKTAYNKKPIAKTSTKKPQMSKMIPGRFEGCTNYADDYKKWPLEPVRETARNEYVVPSQPFQGNTNYADNYHRHDCTVRASMKPQETVCTAGEFQDRTGYRDEYVKHPLEKRLAKRDAEYKPNQAKLDDTTNYRKDFVPKEASKTHSFKPEGTGYRSDAPFQSDTTQRGDFIKWPTERPNIRDPEAYTRPQGDMQFSTTANSAFNKKPLAKVNLSRPAQRKMEPTKFEGTTNYSDDFRKWALDSRPPPTLQPYYKPPDAPFQGQTSYQDNYHSHPGANPTRSMRPDDRGVKTDAPFQGGTEYRQEFIKKASEPCPAALLDGVTARFTFAEQGSTGHKLYRPKSAITSISCKPRTLSGGVSLKAPSRSVIVA